MNLKIQEAVGERKAQLDLTLAWCITRTCEVLSRFKLGKVGLPPAPLGLPIRQRSGGKPTRL